MNKHRELYCLLFLFSCYKSVNADQLKQRIPDVRVQQSSRHYSTSGGAKHTLTQQQIALTGVSSLTDLLHSTAGMQLHDASGTGKFSSLSMRGFGANASSNSLILINGIPLSNPDLMPPDLNTIPLEDIHHIEIIAGSESVLYGDQAVGGLINIITDHQYEKNIRLQCGIGSYQSRECHARISNNFHAIDYQLNLTSKAADNYRTHNHSNNNTLLGSASYQQDKNQLTVNYKFTNEMMQYPGALTAAQVWQNRRQSSNSTDYFKDNNQLLHLKYKQPVWENWTLTTDGFLRAMSGVGVLSASFTQSRGGFFLRPQLVNNNDQHKWQTGFELRDDRYHLESPYGLTNNHQTQAGIFGLANHKLNEKLALIIGARAAQQDTQLNTNITAYTINRAAASTLGLTYAISQELSFYLRRAGSFRFPKAEENTVGHEPLRTQRGVSYESGITYDHTNSKVDLSIYQLNLRDEIAFDPLQTPQNPFGSNTNLAPTKRTGSSIAFTQRLSKLINIDAQLNYADARFTSGVNTGKQIPLVSNWTARGGMLYRITNHFHAYAEGIFTGKQFPANDNANITGGQGGYTLYNFNLRYQYQSFTAALHVNNIFNKNYYLYTVYQTGTEYFYPAPERNFMLTVSYLFD